MPTIITNYSYEPSDDTLEIYLAKISRFGKLELGFEGYNVIDSFNIKSMKTYYDLHTLVFYKGENIKLVIDLKFSDNHIVIENVIRGSLKIDIVNIYYTLAKMFERPIISCDRQTKGGYGLWKQIFKKYRDNFSILKGYNNELSAILIDDEIYAIENKKHIKTFSENNSFLYKLDLKK
jgi:hypothetical protein